METCGEVLRDKGAQVYTIDASATMYEAVQAMCRHHVGALLVCKDGRPRGIISERDIMTRVILQRLKPDEIHVDEAMTREVVCVEPHTTVREAMAVMTERRCRHLPVVMDGHVVGLVSIGDLTRWMSREQEAEIRMLTDYVRGVTICLAV
jgi:CBS domain-containing protein